MKRKKTYPPGTFLPTPQRMIAIIQLCIALSLLMWYAVQPFMGEYFDLRSRMLLYEYVMGNSDILKKQGEELKLQRQANRFEQLPEKQKEQIRDDYRRVQTYAQRSALIKMGDGLKFLLVGIPPFELAWLIFSVVISILLLLKVEGSKQAVWLLPILVLAYAIDNRLEGTPKQAPPDAILFPTEQFIIDNYLKSPLGLNPAEQQAQLKNGWELYLMDQWLPKSNSNDKLLQVEEAEYNFSIARLDKLHRHPLSNWLKSFQDRVSTGWIILYMAWNLLLAWMMQIKISPRPASCEAES